MDMFLYIYISICAKNIIHPFSNQNYSFQVHLSLNYGPENTAFNVMYYVNKVTAGGYVECGMWNVCNGLSNFFVMHNSIR